MLNMRQMPAGTSCKDWFSLLDASQSGRPVGLIMCMPQLAGKAGSQQLHAFRAPQAVQHGSECMVAAFGRGQPALAQHLPGTPLQHFIQGMKMHAQP